ncbi:hypothetical protein [Leptospira neocaledonica]|uniref:Uncharacterized protein n=1 Tax=Leptospira neocaledonica TaxID=2023192 RepID=A0A2M9ZW72_9LEPT|nr:hypothetical protein [Leptospira neocaledonica]PJZ76221.1 hypothetical protein CH365_15485 [Leptospira neocaledonica]
MIEHHVKKLILLFLYFCINSCATIFYFTFGERIDTYGLANTQVLIPLATIKNLQIEHNFTCTAPSDQYVVIISFKDIEDAREELTNELTNIARLIKFVVESERGEVVVSSSEFASLERIGPYYFAKMGIRITSTFFRMNWRDHYKVKVIFPSSIKNLSKYDLVFSIGSLSMDYYTL